MPKDWVKLGEGTFNFAYIDQKAQLVLKIQKNDGEQTDLPERSVRLWNEINAEISPAAYLLSTPFGHGWVCPYVKGMQATDLEMAKALIRIYNKTGRIVIDATSPKNFITTPKGSVVCIDIGMALQLQEDENILMSKTRERRKSIVSLQAWAGLQYKYTSFFDKSEWHYPETVKIIKSLLFIKSYRPDIIDVNFLFNHPKLTKTLSNAYDIQHIYYDFEFWSIRDALDILNALPSGSDQIRDEIEKANLHEPITKKLSQVEVQLQELIPTNFEQVKASCSVEIDRYIRSRGHVDREGKIDTGWITKIFRNRQLTTLKIRKMMDLKNKICLSDTYDKIKEYINILLKDQQAVKSGFGSSALEGSLNRCLQSVATGEKYDLPKQKDLSSSDYQTIQFSK